MTKATTKVKTTKAKVATKATKAPAVPAGRQAKKRTSKKDEAQKIRIRVRAYEHKILDSSIKQIIDTVLRFDAKVV